MKNLSLVLLCMFVVSCGSTKTKLDETLTSVKELAVDVKKTSTEIREETLPSIKKVADQVRESTRTGSAEISKRLTTQSNTLSIVWWVVIVLGSVLTLLIIVAIRYKLTTPMRHSKQLETMLKNGGSEKILKALKPQLHEEFVEKHA